MGNQYFYKMYLELIFDGSLLVALLATEVLEMQIIYFDIRERFTHF